MNLNPRTKLERRLDGWCARFWPGTTEVFLATLRACPNYSCVVVFHIIEMLNYESKRPDELKYLLNILSLTKPPDGKKGVKALTHAFATEGLNNLLRELTTS